MSKERPVDLAASIRQRLLNLSRKRKQDFQLILTRYASERFLYRVSQSSHAESFVLKGATLFQFWTGEMHRPTRDLDLLGFGDSSDESVAETIREICTVSVTPDGLEFDPTSIQIVTIREPDKYQGKRVRLTARLGSAKIRIQIDIGFGDIVTPKLDEITFPTFLKMPAPQLHAYPKETVVAEKLQIIVALGIANSRSKDYYDLWVLSREFSFDGQILASAIGATFKGRQTKIPKQVPLGLTSEFAEDPSQANQWNAFLNRSSLSAGIDFGSILEQLRTFLVPLLEAIGTRTHFKQIWSKGGPWKPLGHS